MNLERPLLPAEKRSDVVTSQIAGFHKDYVDEVKAAIDAHAVVVVGMAQNPVVGRARKALAAVGVAYHYIGHGSYLSGYRRRLAVKMWAGYPTFPMIFVNGVLIGGFRELEPMLPTLRDGALAPTRAGGVASPSGPVTQR